MSTGSPRRGRRRSCRPRPPLRADAGFGESSGRRARRPRAPPGRLTARRFARGPAARGRDRPSSRPRERRPKASVRAERSVPRPCGRGLRLLQHHLATAYRSASGAAGGRGRWPHTQAGAGLASPGAAESPPGARQNAKRVFPGEFASRLLGNRNRFIEACCATWLAALRCAPARRRQNQDREAMQIACYLRSSRQRSSDGRRPVGATPRAIAPPLVGNATSFDVALHKGASLGSVGG